MDDKKGQKQLRNTGQREGMKRTGRRKIWMIISLVMLVISSVCLLCFRSWLRVSPFKPFALESVTGAATDSAGNMYIIDQANQRILKLSPDRRLLWKLEADEKTFEKAQNITCDEEGNVYIQDVHTLKGVRRASEGIVKFSSDGKYLGDIIRLEYTDETKYPNGVMRPSIVGMYGKERGIVYIRKEKDMLYTVNTQDGRTVYLDFPGVEDTVLSCAYDKEKEIIWYTSFDGRICRYVEDGEDVVLYDSAKVKGSIPQTVSYGDGWLYAADIGLRDILAIDVTGGEDGKEAAGEVSQTGFLRMSYSEPVEEREITYFLNAERGLVSVTSYSAAEWTDGEYDCFYDVQLDTHLVVFTVFLWISIVVFSVTAVVDFVWLLWFVVKRMGFFARIVLAIIAGVVALGVLFLATLLPGFQEQLQQAIFSREQLAATVTADRLPKDAFLRLDEPSDYMSEDYMAVRETVASMFLADTDDAKDLYCSLYRVMDGTITLTYTLEDICVVYPYDWEFEGSDEQEILTSGERKTYANSLGSGNYIFILQPIFDDQGETIGLIEVGTDLEGFSKQTNRMMISLVVNVIAMTTVVIMFVVELFYFLAGRKKYKEGLVANTADRSVPAEILRFVAFLIFFFTNLTAAILPIYAMRIAGRGGLLSREMLAAIPISAEVVAGAIFSALGGGVIQKLGGKRAALLSSVLITAGLALRVVPNIWALTFSSVVLGTGWGVLLLMVNILITSLPEAEKDKGFSYYSAAALGGANCGIVFGGFLIQWMSYLVLFIVTTVLSVSLCFVAKSYLSSTVGERRKKTERKVSARKLILNPRVLCFFLMIMVPGLICGYFLNYLYPIIGEQWGLSETHIGYSYLINGMFVLVFGGALTNYFSKKKKLGLAVSAFIYSIGFLIVVLFHNIPSLLAALALLGLSDGFGIPLMTGYYTDLPEVEEYGYDRAFGIYSLVENASQSLGSFVFGYVLLAGVRKGLMVLLVGLSALAVLFLVCGLFDRSGKVVKEGQAS